MRRVFIYGSCVSRDTADTFGDSWEITRYVARQSFISAANGPARLAGKPSLDSAFQNRCLEGDFKGDALPRLRAAVDAESVVLIDIIDERFGVYEADSGRYITKTWELLASGLLAQQPTELRLIEFGTDEHMELFARAAQTIRQVTVDRAAQVFVLAPPLAAVDNRGTSLQYQGSSIHTWNERFDSYYAKLEELGFTLISPLADRVKADNQHKWGLAPFHYTRAVYEDLRETIVASSN